MCDPHVLARASCELQAAYASIRANIVQLGIQQYHEALTEYPYLQDAIVAFEQAMMHLEEADGHLNVAMSVLDVELERRRRPEWLERVA